MDILVTYEDGTTELRAATSPCLLAFEPPARAPGDGLFEVVEVAQGPAWFFCGWTIFEVGDLRSRRAHVWRITGQDSDTKALTGRWVTCRIESVDEQVARLTRERDAAARHLTDAVAQAIALRDAEHRRAEEEKARADAAEKRLADLRAWTGHESRVASMLAETTPDGHLVSRATREERAKVYERIVTRIDGKEGP